MGRFAHFSRHALKRIKQRTGVNYFSIADILDGRMAVDIGQEPVFGRRHWLFYSEPDDCCFVAIQDSMSGLVITVLPLEYHANLAWKISLDDCQKAKTLATSCAGSVASSSASNIPPSIIIVKARYASVEVTQKLLRSRNSRHLITVVICVKYSTMGHSSPKSSTSVGGKPSIHRH